MDVDLMSSVGVLEHAIMRSRGIDLRKDIHCLLACWCAVPSLHSHSSRRRALATLVVIDIETKSLGHSSVGGWSGDVCTTTWIHLTI